MPKYVYHCDSCGVEFEVVHGMMERQEKCGFCFSLSLRRIPQLTSIKTSEFKSQDEYKRTGDRVKEAISENAEILKQQKKEATSWEYEPE